MTVGFILFDLQTDVTDDAMIGLMEALGGDGWRFLKKPLVCDDVPGDRLVPPDHYPQAWRNALRAAPRSGGMVWMEMENYDDFKLMWGYDPRQMRRLLLGVDRALLRRRDQMANARAVTAAAERIYAVLRPYHAYGLFDFENHLLQPVGAGMTAIWDYNFLSTELVEAVGRERLRVVPVWRAVDLPDGGLLLEMAPNPIADGPAHLQFYRHAAQMLAIAYHQGGA